MKPLQRRKFLRAIKTHFGSATSIDPIPKPVVLDQRSDLSIHTNTSRYSANDSSPPVSDLPSHHQIGITIDYIHCKDIFRSDSRKRTITGLNPRSTTLCEVYDWIKNEVELQSGMDLELYFAEGYPLDVNALTIGSKISNYVILQLVQLICVI